MTLRQDGYVFAHHHPGAGSRPCDPDHLSKRFHHLCDLLGVHFDRNLYALRHFAATDLLRAGVGPGTVLDTMVGLEVCGVVEGEPGVVVASRDQPG